MTDTTNVTQNIISLFPPLGIYWNITTNNIIDTVKNDNIHNVICDIINIGEEYEQYEICRVKGERIYKFFF